MSLLVDSIRSNSSNILFIIFWIETRMEIIIFLTDGLLILKYM